MDRDQQLINASDLVAILEEWEAKACDGTENDGTDGTTRVEHPVQTTTQETIGLILSIPRVDAVEVVRCQDCEEWNEDHECGHFSTYGLDKIFRNIKHVTPPDFYCKAGRKRVPNEEPAAE